MDLIQTLYDDECYCTVHFDTSLIELDLDSRSQECKKTKQNETKKVCANYLTKFSLDLNGIWSTRETCWCDELHIHLFCPFGIQGREPHIMISLQKCLYSDINRTMSFNLYMMIKTTKLYIISLLVFRH